MLNLGDRVHNKLIIGSNGITPDHIEQVAFTLAKRYGGLTITRGTGYWYEDGADNKVTYTGELQRETNYIIEVSMPVADFDPDYIRSAFCTLSAVAEWIHWEQMLVKAAHFQLSTLVPFTASTITDTMAA